MDTNHRKLLNSLNNLELAIARLEEALSEDATNPLIVDGTIQRFEFTIELFWKTLKRALQSEGIETKTPKEALKEAYQAGWLNDESAWLQMLKDRNETLHTYNEELAREILAHIHQYFPEMKRVSEFVLNKYQEGSS
ncbi:HI0074 family nucleotidyltransferase substrate-binding subunit [Jeotgalibacillus sp. R-1-5s-1]|uniref:HI0074 family nucleotidyltransferase substrate-binding subunit n=1 Tax=Jeotgalibacillus sp. R-1-5s-1 TaxID=2555897 RepID=UPI00106CB0D7|nr:HI0074 family nucleotidyltransferase substrate-binding subunit [Jeotgalibacillus sp. R-1-5s-1]TFD96997.1 DUF86 domain-containing protein [Jeotgalibacillus sp. R-1-5s-1]